MNWRLWMDGAIAALGTAALGAAFVFDFVAGKTEGTTLQVATTLAYPLGDIAMLAMVVGVVALTGWRPGRTWSLLLAGLSALVVADIAYTLQIDREALPRRQLDRPDLPDRRGLPRRRRLAAGGGGRDHLARDGAPPPRDRRPGGLRRGDDRPLRDAVLQRDQRPLHGPLGGDDDRGDRPPGDERPREQGPARAGADRLR